MKVLLGTAYSSKLVAPMQDKKEEELTIDHLSLLRAGIQSFPFKSSWASLPETRYE